jgi:hypothetical protein
MAKFDRLRFNAEVCTSCVAWPAADELETVLVAALINAICRIVPRNPSPEVSADAWKNFSRNINHFAGETCPRSRPEKELWDFFPVPSGAAKPGWPLAEFSLTIFHHPIVRPFRPSSHPSPQPCAARFPGSRGAISRLSGWKRHVMERSRFAQALTRRLPLIRSKTLRAEWRDGSGRSDGLDWWRFECGLVCSTPFAPHRAARARFGRERRERSERLPRRRFRLSPTPPPDPATWGDRSRAPD